MCKVKKSYLILLIGIFMFSPLHMCAQEYTDIDNYVLSLNLGSYMPKYEVAKAVTRTAKTKEDRARAIFIWMTDNIVYDTDYKIYDGDAAFRLRKGVCQAYSELYADMCKSVGVNVIIASGRSKWYNYSRNGRLGEHAWNLVQVDDGGYILVDVTWGAGSVNGGVFEKELKDYWFYSDPNLFVFTHLPSNESYQLLKMPVSMSLFERLPGINPSLTRMGLDGKSLLNYFKDNDNAWMPFFYGSKCGLGLKIVNMPFTKELKKGATYSFEFIVADNVKAALINNKKWTYIESGKAIEYIPLEMGEVGLYIKEEGDASYQGVLKYDVK